MPHHQLIEVWVIGTKEKEVLLVTLDKRGQYYERKIFEGYSCFCCRWAEHFSHPTAKAMGQIVMRFTPLFE